MNDVRSPNSSAPLRKTETDIVERKIGKLIPKVPTMKIITRIVLRSLRFQTYRKPSARLPHSFFTAGSRCAITSRIEPIATRTGRNDAALTRKTQPVPIFAMSTPAIAGPIMRAELNEVEFSATAFPRSFSPTRSPTNACRTGASKAVTQPRRNANT